jgi:hypothetical protein
MTAWRVAGSVARGVSLRGLGIGPDRAGGLVSRNGHSGLLTYDVGAYGQSLTGPVGISGQIILTERFGQYTFLRDGT